MYKTIKPIRNKNMNNDYLNPEEFKSIYTGLLLPLDFEHRKYLNNMTVEEIKWWHTEYLNRCRKTMEEFNKDFKEYNENKNI